MACNSPEADKRPSAVQVIAVCKSADLLLMVLDAGKPNIHRDILTRELESVGIRLNREPPRIYLKRKKTGGLSFNSTLPLTKLDEKLVQRVLQEYKVHNADVLIKEDASVDDLIDVLEVCCGKIPWPRALPATSRMSLCSVDRFCLYATC